MFYGVVGLLSLVYSCSADLLECTQDPTCFKHLNANVSSTVDELYLLQTLRELTNRSASLREHALSTMLSIRDRLLEIQPKRHNWARFQRTQETVAASQAWLRKKFGGLTAAFDIVHHSVYGFSLIANRRIPAYSLIATIPINETMSSARATAVLRCVDLPSTADVERITEATVPSMTYLWPFAPLALQVIIEEAKGRQSHFAPYIDLFPSADNISMAVYFNADDYTALSQSIVYDYSVKVQQEVLLQYATYAFQLRQRTACAQTTGLTENLLTLENYRWAFSVSLIRHLNGDVFSGETNHALVPFWDFGNHADENTLGINVVKPDTQQRSVVDGPPYPSYVPMTVQHFRPGDMATTTYYSPMKPEYALAHYGFVEVGTVPLQLPGGRGLLDLEIEGGTFGDQKQIQSIRKSLEATGYSGSAYHYIRDQIQSNIQNSKLENAELLYRQINEKTGQRLAIATLILNQIIEEQRILRFIWQEADRLSNIHNEL